MIDNLLLELGLSKTEAKVYLTLLSLRSVAASSLSRHAKIPRTTAKYACEQLVKRGLAKRINRNNCWYYSPCDPNQLKGLLEVKRIELENQESLLKNAIGDLLEVYKRDEVTPRVQFFEGADGVIEMMQDVLRSKETIYGALSLHEEMHPVIREFFEDNYQPERKKGGQASYMLFNDNEKTRHYQKGDADFNRVSMLVSEDEFPFHICFHIYGNKVAFYSYKSSMITGVIIQDTHIREMQFSLFKMAWKLAQGMKKNADYKGVELAGN